MRDYINNSESSVYVVSHNGIDVYHYGEVAPGEQCTTGQPYQEIFATQSEMLAFVPEGYRQEG